MKGVTFIAALSMMGWCDSLGDGCVPLFAEGHGESASSSSTTGDPALTSAPTGTTPTGSVTTGTSETSETTGQDSVGTTEGVVTGTTSTGAETTGSTSGTGADSETTAGPAVCGNGNLEPGEACEPALGLEPGVLECDANCEAVRAVDLAAGSAHACVLLSDGRVRCWGDNNNFGQLGSAKMLADVKLANQLPLDANGPGDGEIDLAADVRLDTGNGRVFAGGSTTCVTSASATKTWCWGHGFDGVTPKETAYHYSSVAMGDGADWWMCGMVWVDENEHTLRCWGDDSMNKGLFESLKNANTCQSTVTEIDAGTRSLALAGKTPKLDLGRELGCAPSGGAMLCAGNDGKICDGDVNTKPCVAKSPLGCPAGCKEVSCADHALDVAIWEYNLCYVPTIDPSTVECYPQEPKSADLKTCSNDFKAAQVSVSKDFWCAFDPKQAAGGQVCCSNFDQSLFALVDFKVPAPNFVKIVSQSDSMLLLGQDGRVLQVSKGVDAWAAQDAL